MGRHVGLERRQAGRPIADVELQDARRAAEALDLARRGLGGVAAGQAVQHEVEAVGSETQGDCAADAAA